MEVLSIHTLYHHNSNYYYDIVTLNMAVVDRVLKFILGFMLLAI